MSKFSQNPSGFYREVGYETCDGCCFNTDERSFSDADDLIGGCYESICKPVKFAEKPKPTTKRFEDELKELLFKHTKETGQSVTRIFVRERLITGEPIVLEVEYNYGS